MGYYTDKTNKVFEELANTDGHEDDIKSIVKKAIEEVARDQRYKCLDEVKTYDSICTSDKFPVALGDTIFSLIRNSELGD